MATAAPPRERAQHYSPRMREGGRVMPLELFFDLVFVLALTQCTALMAAHPTWSGLAQGLLVLAVLWWSWAGYAWLTSVVDPEEGAVRIAIFAAMAAFLLVAICVPEAFDSLALQFAVGYAAVRGGHIALFVLASRDDPDLRHSVAGLGISTAAATGLLIAASFTDGAAQGGLWILALLVDMIPPYLFGTEGWRLEPAHFAERHGLIVIIALGESIVAIGVGAEASLTLGITAAAIAGIALAAAQWWMYFDVVALVSARRLIQSEPGRDQNALARDSYSYIHFLMVAGIIMVALALKKTLGDVDEPLKTVPAFALTGGIAVFLLGLVCFRWRHVHTVNRLRFAYALVLLAVFPLATEVPALAAVAIVTAILWAIITYETRVVYGERRGPLRDELAH